jgi:hypothetical protein
MDDNDRTGIDEIVKHSPNLLLGSVCLYPSSTVTMFSDPLVFTVPGVVPKSTPPERPLRHLAHIPMAAPKTIKPQKTSRSPPKSISYFICLTLHRQFDIKMFSKFQIVNCWIRHLPCRFFWALKKNGDRLVKVELKHTERHQSTVMFYL